MSRELNSPSRDWPSRVVPCLSLTHPCILTWYLWTERNYKRQLYSRVSGALVCETGVDVANVLTVLGGGTWWGASAAWLHKARDEALYVDSACGRDRSGGEGVSGHRPARVYLVDV